MYNEEGSDHSGSKQRSIYRDQILLNSARLQNIEKRFSLITRTCDLDPQQLQVDDTFIAAQGTIALISRKHLFNDEYFVECCNFDFFSYSLSVCTYRLSELMVESFDLFVRERTSIPDSCFIFCQPSQHLQVSSCLTRHTGAEPVGILAKNIATLLSLAKRVKDPDMANTVKSLSLHIDNSCGKLYLATPQTSGVESEDAALTLFLNTNDDPVHDFILDVRLSSDSSICRRALELTGLSIVLANRYCSAMRIYDSVYSTTRRSLRNLKPIKVGR